MYVELSSAALSPVHWQAEFAESRNHSPRYLGGYDLSRAFASGLVSG
jgi:hypothetical protein